MKRDHDSIRNLRAYRELAPWNLHGLVTITSGVLETSGVRPTSAAASVTPTHRTIRYYVALGLVDPPFGRGAAATYGYRHFLQVLSVKLRQMEGQTIATISAALPTLATEAMEINLAQAFELSLPPPTELLMTEALPRGRSGHAVRGLVALGEEEEVELSEMGPRFTKTKWHRIPIVRGLELHLHEGHPLAIRVKNSDTIAKAVRRAVSRLLAVPDEE